ncbi:ERCC4 domain protein, partial [Teladorsagia circumcincta]
DTSTERTKASHTSVESEERGCGSQQVESGSEASTVCSAETGSSENISYCACEPKDKAEMEMRPLSVGDYLWVARKIDGTEIVLDWIVERKTWSDLHHSIRSKGIAREKIAEAVNLARYVYCTIIGYLIRDPYHLRTYTRGR